MGLTKSQHILITKDRIIIEIGEEHLTIQRGKSEEIIAEDDQLPEDVDDESPVA